MCGIKLLSFILSCEVVRWGDIYEVVSTYEIEKRGRNYHFLLDSTMYSYPSLSIKPMYCISVFM